MDIHSRTLRSLEWDRLKALLAECAVTVCSKELCLALEPNSERAAVQILLDETQEALSLLHAGQGLYVGGLPDLRTSLNRLKAGAVLSTNELVDLRTTIVLAKNLRASISLLAKDIFPQLTSYLANLHPLADLLQSIDDSIDKNGEIKDEASPELGLLRREVKKIDNTIKQELLKLIRSSTISKALQELIYTQRSGRYVLPVNANMRATVQGIVHDSSASGLTVYIEPMSVIEPANKMRIKEAEIEHEIARILARLSYMAQQNEAEIESSFRTLVELDFIMAKARFALKYDGHLPILARNRKLDLRQARHPLLILQSSKDQVVANDITLGANARTLVITGPNTGGKTVLLKTVGLLSVMLLSGLLLPVAPGSQAVVFTSICADIGDEQSLEQSLSTFSSHMTNIVQIVNKADPGMLVLLDEIGAGTDPKEGAALARSILEYLNNAGAVTVATTHFGELKILAYSQEGFVNGSLKFDDQSLTPTYRLNPGIPGSSKAMTVAQRLGLNDKIVAQARQLLGRSEDDLSHIVERLEEKLRQVSLQEEALADKLRSVSKREDELTEQREDFEEHCLKEKTAFASALEQEYRTASDLIRSMVAELQRQPGLAKIQKIQAQLEALRQELGWTHTQTGDSTKKADLSLGTTVKIKSLNQYGVVEALPDNTEGRKSVLVRAGRIKIKVPCSDIEVLPDKKNEKQAERARSGGNDVGGCRSGSNGIEASGAAKIKMKQQRSEERRCGGNDAGVAEADLIGPRDEGSVYTAERARDEASGAITKKTEKIRKRPKSTPPQTSRSKRDTNLFVSTESNTLNLHGQRVDEAIIELERFLDRSVVSDTSPIMIIHGHGTGALKNAVRNFLRKTYYANTQRPGETYEGGDGVTIVDLS